MAAASPRVVSLVPSVTETLLAWGIVPVACTRFCEQPDLPHVGGTKDPDVPAIVALAPDLVVVDEEENRREDAEALVAAGLEVHALAVRSVVDVPAQLSRLADRLGLAAAAIVGVAPVVGLAPVRAFVPIWRRPWMTISAQTYGSSLLAHLAVENVFGEAGERYPETTLHEAAARRPGVVLAPSEPYPFSERHRAELEAVAPVVFVDGRDLFWWGARTPGAHARLGEIVSALR